MADNLQQLQETIDKLNQVINDMSTNFSNVSRQTRDLGESIRQNMQVETASTNLERQIFQQKQDEKAQHEQWKRSARDAQSAVVSFGQALLNQERNFSKYSQAVGSATDALSGFVSSLGGPAFQAIGLTIKALGFLGQKALEQTDNLLKASDQLSKIGAISFTTNDLRNFAHSIELNTKNLELMVNPIRSLGPALLTLGDNTSAGAKKFIEVAAVGERVRSQFLRLGISQGELIQLQTSYIQLQKDSSIVLTGDLKTSVGLQSATLKYINLLQDLSALTGQDIESTQKRVNQAALEYEYNVKQLQLSQKINLATGADREQLITLQENLQLVNAIAPQFRGQQGTRELMSFLISGGAVRSPAAAGQVQALMAGGVDPFEFARSLGTRRLSEQEVLRIMQQGSRGSAELSQIIPAGLNPEASQQVGAIVGLPEQFDVAEAARRGIGSTDIVDTYNKTVEERRKKEVASYDAAQDARVALTNLEIKAAQALDTLVNAINPLNKEFGDLTKNLVTFGAAISALTVGMSLALTRLSTGAAAGAELPLPAGAGRAAKIGQQLGRFAPGVGVALAGKAGTDFLAGQFEDNSMASRLTNILGTAGSFAAGGAMIGGGYGALAGGALGLGFGLYQEFGGKKNKAAKEEELKPGENPYSEANLKNYIQFMNNESGDYESLMTMQPAALEAFVAMAKAYKNTYGEKLKLNSSKRTFEEQLNAYLDFEAGNSPFPAVDPRKGVSAHQEGKSIDTNSDQYQNLAKISSNFGYEWFGPKDNIHFTFAGPELHKGGITKGNSEFLAKLKPDEVITPLKQDSILQMLAQTPASKQDDKMEKITDQSSQIRELQNQNTMLLSALTDIKNAFVNGMDMSIDIQDRMLKYMQV